MSVRVEPDAAHMAGHAVIVVAGGTGGVGAPGFRVQRDAGWGDDKLGPGGWQSSDALLQPDRAEAVGGNLLLHVGWGVCRHLEAGIFEISVPGAGQEAIGVYWPEIVPLYEGGGQGSVARGQEAAVGRREAFAGRQGGVDDALETVVLRPEKPAVVAAPVVTPPMITPASVPPPVQPAYVEPKSGILVVAGIVGLLLLLLAGGGVYWWLHRPGEVVIADPLVVPPVVPPVVSPAVPPVLPTAGLAAMSVPDVLAKAPTVGAITAEGRRRLQGTQRDDGMLLLEAAADRGDAGAAAVLARLYDPVLFQPGGPIPRADARQAARYYRDASRGGVDVAAAREALRQRLLGQSGDLSATLVLKDFWP